MDKQLISSFNYNLINKHYGWMSDDDAGVEVIASPMNKPLTMHGPVLFDYGENDKGGYRDYNYMVTQFQDVINCLIVMHPKYQFYFFV